MDPGKVRADASPLRNLPTITVDHHGSAAPRPEPAGAGPL